MSRQRLTQKVNAGDEPISNTIVGLDANWKTESGMITRMVDRLPFFATKEVTSANGLFYGGGFTQLGKQAIAAGAVLAYSFCVSYILAQIVNRTIGFRISEEDEVTGRPYSARWTFQARRSTSKGSDPMT